MESTRKTHFMGCHHRHGKLKRALKCNVGSVPVPFKLQMKCKKNQRIRPYMGNVMAAVEAKAAAGMTTAAASTVVAHEPKSSLEEEEEGSHKLEPCQTISTFSTITPSAENIDQTDNGDNAVAADEIQVSQKKQRNKKNVLFETSYALNENRSVFVSVGYNAQDNFLPCIMFSAHKKSVCLPYTDVTSLFCNVDKLLSAVHEGNSLKIKFMTDGNLARVTKAYGTYYVFIVTDRKKIVVLSEENWKNFKALIPCLESVITSYLFNSQELAIVAHNLRETDEAKKKKLPRHCHINLNQAMYELTM